MAPYGKQVALFLGIFMSALMLFFGSGMLLLMVTPVIAQTLAPGPEFKPALPETPDRAPDFFASDTTGIRQPYPALRATVTNDSTGNWIRIPALDIAVPLVLSPSLADNDVLDTLELGAALYPNGVEPGHLGNAFISAHSTGEPWKGKYRFAFLRINELELGQVMHLDYNGTRYTYRVVDKEIITPTPDYQVESGRPKPTVTLMACWPLWSTKQRVLLTAELTNITQLTEAPTQS